LLTACLRGQKLLSIALGVNGERVEKVESWLVNQFGRLREVIQADDGSLYLTTSNRDGRGNPDQYDDKIIRLVP
jgi:glucose/arabinose dehydrogenase